MDFLERFSFSQKPYICKAPGCTKRYTDPSSLRKHVKTVHGAEFYANKRHKGTPSHPSSSDDGHGGTSNASGGFDSSPRSAEDIQSINGGKNTSVSSPSIKSESDAHSPDQQINSPVSRLSGMKQQTSNGSMMMSTGGGTAQLINDSVSAIEDPAWPYEDEDLEVKMTHKNNLFNSLIKFIASSPQKVADLPIVLRAMVGLSPSIEGNDVGFGRIGDGVLTPAQLVDRNPRNRFKPRLQAKGMSSLSNIPEIGRRIVQNMDVNKRIADMKMEPLNGGNGVATAVPQTTEIPLRLLLPTTSTTTSCTNTIRRDSICSNASSFYCSMKSTDISRRSSQTSQYSNILSSPPNTANGYGMQQNAHINHINYNASSFYDPISPGSSRRSSEMSTITTGGHSLPPPASSHLLSLGDATHNYGGSRPRFYGNRCSVPTITPIGSVNDNGLGQLGIDGASFDRRMSEPVKSNADNNLLLSPKHRPRSVTPKSATIVKPLTEAAANIVPTVPPTNVVPHPNPVDLNEVEEDEMVEDKILIPEEFENYLNQVADIEGGNKANEETTNGTSVPTTANAATLGVDETNKNQTVQAAAFNRSMWRDPSSNLYPISPITQPHSPSSISHTIPASPQTPGYAAGTPTTMMQQNVNKSPYHQPYTAPSSQYSQYYNQNVQNNVILPDYNDHMQSRVTQNAMSQQFVGNGGFAPSVQHQLDQMTMHGASTMAENACQQTPGYYHRTDQSAMNCCQLMRALQINDDSHSMTTTTTTTTTTIAATTTTIVNGSVINTNAAGDIQCGDISQSQLSPPVPPPNTHLAAHTQHQPQTNLFVNTNTNTNTNIGGNQSAMLGPQMQPNYAYNTGMRQDTYQRTLEYVQSCQTWAENTETVSSSTHPLNNMTISDMTTSLNSLIEENRYLQMQQTIQ